MNPDCEKNFTHRGEDLAGMFLKVNISTHIWRDDIYVRMGQSRGCVAQRWPSSTAKPGSFLLKLRTAKIFDRAIVMTSGNVNFAIV
ncbi:MAG: hypothetical protein ACI845_003322 [Gammaproteobacteria bacterium]|jgi:hypothetical protein